MTPHLGPELSFAARRQFLRILLTTSCGLSALGGCTGPLVRSQSPEPESFIDEEVEKRVKLIGDLTAVWNFTYLEVKSVALVNGLDNTGSDPPPSPQRQSLIAEIQARGVKNPSQLLAQPDTAMVICRGFLPPGCQKGDPFDIEVRTAPQTETTSLRGGWLMPTYMSENERLGGTMKKGHDIANATGAVMVDSLFQNTRDEVAETRGRVLAGGVAQISRPLGLAVKDEFYTPRLSPMIGSVINLRFSTYDRGLKSGVATPKTDNFIELRVHSRYKHNLARYIHVVRSIAVNESPSDRGQRIMQLDRMIADPATSSRAALQLEAIGKKEGAPVLKKALNSSDPEVRFYAAEALAYLDEPAAAPALKDAALLEPAYRWHAITALATLEDLSADEALNALMHVPSAETRYGAFRALRIRNPRDPLIKGEVFHEEFTLHVVPSSAEPLVHFTRSTKPEIVIFGDQLQLLPPNVLFAGKNISIKRAGEGLTVKRLGTGNESDLVADCSPRLDDVLRTVAKLGGHYEQMLELVHEAKRQNYLAARIVVDALPNSNRIIEKQIEDATLAAAARRRQAATPLPELFMNRLSQAGETEESEDDSGLARAQRLEQEAREESKELSIWSRMMPWNYFNSR